MSDYQAQARPRRPATRRDFEIAIICALIHEADAVEALFDHHWDDDGPPYDKAPGDPNAYSTGVIGRHNVVLAHMPGMGKINATTVGSHCRTSFPGIRLALVVGICGVVPTDRDGKEIVLGDVIISDAIIQYDFGRRLPERFVRKDTLLDSLGRPNTEIRSLLAKLKGFRGRKTLHTKSISYLAVVQQEPALIAQYPGVEADKLFDPSYRHVEDGKLCDDCGCVGPLTQRTRLGGGSPTPLVHFGLIASGDTVLKSGEDRDAIAQQEEVIAFEMESAGVWDQFPCVVIKGACDYADSHKMKAWHHYAAATAASCMKAFLDSWVPSSSSGTGDPGVAVQTEALGRLRIEEGPRAVLNQTAEPLSRVFMVPFLRNMKFTGREHVLEELKERLFLHQDCRTLAIIGLGGVGKTQIVLQFAYWVKEKQPDVSVFWVPAYSEEIFEQSFLDIATDMKIPIKEDDKDSKSTIRKYLSSEAAGKWLMIVDNADDEEMVLKSQRSLLEYLPQSDNGLTILTTRSPEVSVSLAEGNEIHLEEMGNQEATDLLRKSLSRKELLQDAEMTSTLLEELTYLPLAITQAAAYLNRNPHVSVQRYLELLHGTEQDMTSLLTREFHDSTRYRTSQYQDSRNAVATTWMVSFDQIQKTDTDAANLLSFMSCIEPKSIPRSILPPLNSDAVLEDAIGTLTGYSFLVHEKASDMFNMHRLVHVATRVWLSKQGRTVTAETEAICRLRTILQDAKRGASHWWQPYYPHAFRLLDSSEGYDADERYDLCFNVGYCLWADRRFKDGIPYFESVSMWRARHLKDEDPSRLTAEHNLGSAYIGAGQIQEAIEILERVVHIRRRTLSDTDKNRLNSEHELAGAYIFIGRTNDAIEILENKVAVETKMLPERLSTLLISKHELARAYLKDNRTQEAIKLLEYVAEQQRERLDETDHNRLTTEHNLARAYLNDGQVQKAVDLFEYIVRIRKTTLDATDPGLLASQHGLARAYLNDHQVQKAVNLFEYIVRIRKTTLDATDPGLLASQHELARAYLEDSQPERAVGLLEHVVAMKSRRLNEDHPSRRVSVKELEYAYKKLRAVQTTDGVISESGITNS
ncbi:purine and uridine phosphorylase [Apiospora saccharicola]